MRVGKGLWSHESYPTGLPPQGESFLESKLLHSEKHLLLGLSAPPGSISEFVVMSALSGIRTPLLYPASLLITR
jgi:hypothetical protein